MAKVSGEPGEGEYIIGIKISRDRSKQLIALNQSAYFDKVLKKFKMENSKRGSVPMQEKPNLSKAQGGNTPSEVNDMQRVPYAPAIGSIMYAIRYSEYIDVVEASMEAVWMGKFINELGNIMPANKRPMEMLCDNMPTIAIANDPGIMKGARHYQRKYHYICKVIQDCEIVLKKVHTDDNVADLFMKQMLYTKHFEHAMAIEVRPASSLM
uniref:Retrotransposon protein, putative, Ty1-copia subclass n=1 Tax=Tanacetum cinerariifolium TaxID=118510 RepID=A0A6L2JV15_TANCI|nr:retrotransposon protein, putative, Ty1-copia subclass [Tanacetum cinerariifolium]